MGFCNGRWWGENGLIVDRLLPREYGRRATRGLIVKDKLYYHSDLFFKCIYAIR